jgi:hypothetical protein
MASRRVLASVADRVGRVLLASAVCACSAPSPTPHPEATQSGPPVGGNEWTLLRSVSPSVEEEGLAIAPLGPDQYVLSITVRAGGSDGCNTPALAGFERSRTTLVAQIVRSPVSPNSICATTSDVTFYVALNRVVSAEGVDQVALNDSCQSAPCPAPISVPNP